MAITARWGCLLRGYGGREFHAERGLRGQESE